MEVIVRDIQGIDSDTILSIRAGSCRRQAALNSGQPLQFPTLPFNASSLKIDLFRPAGSSRISLSPEQEMYSVLFPAEVGAFASMQMQVRAVPQLCGHAAGGRSSHPVDAENVAMQKAAIVEDARAYLDRFGLLHFMQELLRYIIREKPEDPFVFMATYLSRMGCDRNASVEGSTEEVVTRTLHRHNDRLDEENERIRKEIAAFRKICDETSSHAGPIPDIAPEESVALIGSAAAALENALRIRREALECSNAAQDHLAEHEDLHRALTTFCNGFTELATKLTKVVVPTPHYEEEEAVLTNAQLEAENEELNRQIQELERTLLAPSSRHELA